MLKHREQEWGLGVSAETEYDVGVKSEAPCR